MHRIETIGDAAGMRDLTKSEVAVYDGISDLAPSTAAADYCVFRLWLSLSSSRQDRSSRRLDGILPKRSPAAVVEAVGEIAITIEPMLLYATLEAFS